MRIAAGRPMRALQPALLAHAGTVAPMASAASPRTSGGGALASLLGGAFASNVRTATTQSR